MASRELPAELLDMVVLQLAPMERTLFQYASVSKEFQRAIERRTFEYLKLTIANEQAFAHLDRLKFFERAVLPLPHRQRSLKTISFDIVLPTYTDIACARYERDADKRLNSEAFTKTLLRLFNALGACEVTGFPKSIRINMQNIYSPMDRLFRNKDKYQSDRYEQDIGRRKDLFEHRYEHSFLTFPQQQDIPCLRRVISFSVSGTGKSRAIEPAVAAILAQRLPELENMSWHLRDTELRYPNERTRMRMDFGQALNQLNLPLLESFHLRLRTESITDERFTPADVSGTLPGITGDVFTHYLRDFTRRHNLKFLSLEGPICIDETFFSSAESPTASIWPSLETLELTYSKERPLGGWYFDSDPGTTLEEPEDEMRNGDSDSDETSESSYDSDESFFQEKEDVPDSHNQTREERLTGMGCDFRFRSMPNAALERLLEAAAQAAALMPRLRSMRVYAEIENCSRTDYTSQRFEFAYFAKDVTTVFDDNVTDSLRNRVYWACPSNWKMSERLEQFWRAVIHEEGFFRYDTW